MQTLTTIPKDKLKWLETLELESGGHSAESGQLCVNEAVAYFAGEEHSDMPPCMCPVIGRATMRLNDRIPDKAERTALLKNLIPRLAGSKSTKAVEKKRGYVAADFAVRVFTPRWLELANLPELAKQLRNLAPIVNEKTAKAARAAVEKVRETTWPLRQKAYATRYAAVKSAVEKAIADGKVKIPVDAAAAAAAVAVVDAAAAAAVAAAAAADAVADVDAAAAAAAAAVADAAVAAAADAVAAADAELKYGTNAYWAWRDSFRDSFRKSYRARLDAVFGGAIARSRKDCVEMIERMLDVGA